MLAAAVVGEAIVALVLAQGADLVTCEPSWSRLSVVGGGTHQSADDVVAAALDSLERDRFWLAYDSAAAAVAADPVAAAQDLEELAQWDVTLIDAPDD